MATFHVPIFEGGNRAIGLALVVSLALHLALLIMLPPLREAHQRKSDAELLQARLVEPPPRRVVEPAIPAPALEPIRPSAPEVQAPKHATPQAPPKRSPPTASLPAPAVPRTETRAPVPPRTEPAETELSSMAPSAATTVAPSASIAAPAPRTAPPPADTLDAGTLAQYRLAIMSAARRFKRYPRVALDQNWQGKVEIRLVIAANGEISALTVRASAGYTVLDEHALGMIERAKAMAQIPPALRGKEFALDIPIVFSLRDADG